MGERFSELPTPHLSFTALFITWWSLHKKSSPLKPLGQMNRNLIGSSSTTVEVQMYA
jgi:hypothetical protein